jgi:cellulose synthase operon protein C
MTSNRLLALRPALLGLCALCVAAVSSPALGHDFARHSVPGKWVEPVTPEDLPPLELPEYYTDLERARAQAFAGRYKLALATLGKVGADADVAEVAHVRATAQAALGRYDDALRTLSDAAVADKPNVQVLRATVLSDLGRTDESIALLNEHLKAHPDSIPGHYWLGAVLEKVGDLEAATAAYAWFLDDPQRLLDKWQGLGAEPFNNDAALVTLLGRAVDRHATLTESYKNSRQLHDAVLEMFVQSYDVIDRGYWPAHVAAAEYFLSHDQMQEAREELAAALEANPNDGRALRLIGLVSLDVFNFDAVDRVVASLRSVDPTSIDAAILEGRNLLRQRRPKDAEAVLSSVLARQPKHIEALGLLAGAHALQLHDERTNELLKQVDTIDVGADNATAYFEVAEQLSAMRQYPRAAAMYDTAIARAPWWTAPRNGLGLLYTQWGDDDKARATLDAARLLDPFNLATTNYTRLLDGLKKFATHETPHFLIRYDAAVDPIIPEYFSEYLESIYPKVTGTFQSEPTEKTVIEVYPTHDGFSVRTTGSPWIGTVGASTGRIIAMVSPRGGKQTMGPFHWANVLRHEFTHTVTLAATDNRIAHWMTEGLAVLEEDVPLRWEWVPMLHRAVTKHELFTMENLTWGFVRPKKPSDRALAYAQSYWVCKYIQETYGHDKLLAMLAEFKAGGTQEDVFPKVLGKDLAAFTTEFFAWADKQVEGWGYDKETSEKYEDLKERAEAMTKSRQYAEAVKLWQEIAAIRPVDELPHRRLAGLYLQLKEPAKAAEHFVALHKVEMKDNRFAKRVARIYRDLGTTDEALRYAKESVYIDPYDTDAHVLLAELYEKTGDEAGLSRERRVIVTLEQWHKQQRQSGQSTQQQPVGVGTGQPE